MKIKADYGVIQAATQHTIDMAYQYQKKVQTMPLYPDSQCKFINNTVVIPPCFVHPAPWDKRQVPEIGRSHLVIGHTTTNQCWD